MGTIFSSIENAIYCVFLNLKSTICRWFAISSRAP
nr:MAG TPA: hypothetical protein [Caudoviricetes sp.]